MRVFLSWSGDRSYRVAAALRDFLPSVLQTLQPWLSPRDIESGRPWAAELAEALKSADLAILCVTAENLLSPWFLYEAGAATKYTANVYPYLLDLAPSDLTGPLSQFQAATATRDDTLRLLRRINSMEDLKLPESAIDNIFALWWPMLDSNFAAIRGDTVGRPVLPAEMSDDVIGEIHRLASLIEQVFERVAQMSERFDRQSVPEPVAGARMTPPSGRPRVFIGSSTEGLPVAGALQANLDKAAEVTIWNQDLFPPMKTAIETLVDAQAAFDFAIIVMTPDDLLSKRGTMSPVPRDNLIFELGLFTGALGRARTFLVCNSDRDIELPSDLDGVSRVEYGERSDGNFRAAAGPAAQRILRAMGLA